MGFVRLSIAISASEVGDVPKCVLMYLLLYTWLFLHEDDFRTKDGFDIVEVGVSLDILSWRLEDAML